MKRTLITVALLAAVVLVAPSEARGGSWFGLHVGSDGVGFSLGFSTYEPYTSAWYDPAWSIHFETALSPYGDWMHVGGLGYVWRPAVAASWRPYTMGRWVWTSYGWTWVAYEPWGYVPHHFGQWALTGRGWVWVPGHTWRPASVSWVHCGSMIGWYPTAPAGWHHAYAAGYDRGWGRGYNTGYTDGWRDARYATWVEWSRFASDNVSRHARPWHEVSHAARDHRVSRLDAAPSRREIERRTGQPVRTVKTSVRSARVDGRAVTLVRPEGVDRSIEAHAERTVNRGLARDVSARLERTARKGRGAGPSAEASRRATIETRSLRRSEPQYSSSHSTSRAGHHPDSSTHMIREHPVNRGNASSRVVRSPDTQTSSRTLRARSAGGQSTPSGTARKPVDAPRSTVVSRPARSYRTDIRASRSSTSRSTSRSTTSPVTRRVTARHTRSSRTTPSSATTPPTVVRRGSNRSTTATPRTTSTPSRSKTSIDRGRRPTSHAVKKPAGQSGSHARKRR